MKKILVIALLLLLPAGELFGKDTILHFTDSTGRKITLNTHPKRVVSLVPSITEMLFHLGAGQTVLGVTHHDINPAEASEKALVGGFLNPDLDRIAALEPDTIFYASIQDGVVDRFKESATLINLSVSSIEESYTQIKLLGKIFDCREKAEEIITEQLRQLALIKKKTSLIPADKRLRTVRLMGSDKVMVPGDDSFQNEYIRRAGGIPPLFGATGSVIEPGLDQWQEFNPQVIYGCGDNRDLLPLLNQPGWRDVDAVKNNRIIFFPCSLTCRASTNTGYFVSWLAARLYSKEFADPKQLVLPKAIVTRRPLELGHDYVKKTEIIYSDILDFRNKSLLIQLTNPMTILSSLEGWRKDIRYIGNHYFPPPSWGLGHNEGLAELKHRTYATLGLEENDTAMLFTGADMDNLAIATARFKDMQVTALVTAGVKGNAVRMGKDIGAYYELDKLDETKKKKKPGTINTILLTNTALSERAMTRAMINAVEGKSAALQDLDIRSSVTPERHAATGTGTDNILIFQGSGPPIDATGGHTKMGELIARAVYEGVTEAIKKQNGITASRSIFARLQERKSSIFKLSRLCAWGNELSMKLEQLLLNPEYSSFLSAAFAISDQYERGLVADLSSFENWCHLIATTIAGRHIEEVKELEAPDQPLVMRKAFGALISGLKEMQQGDMDGI